MDKCTQTAHKQFPDYTPDGNAKREAARQKCLRAGNLPSDVDASPPDAGPAAQGKQGQ